jgi:hypothetical protein
MNHKKSNFEPYSKLFQKTKVNGMVPQFHENWMNQLPKKSVEINVMNNKNKLIPILGLAASILVALGVFFFVEKETPKSQELNQQGVVQPDEKKVEYKQMKAIVLFIKGKATKADGTRLYQGNILKENESIQTGPKSTIDIGFADSGVIRLSEKSSITLEKLQTSNFGFSLQFKVNVGKLFNIAPKMTKGSSYEVHTPTSVAGVRGTSFEVNSGDKSSVIIVYEGTVQVRSLIKDKKEFIVSKDEKVVINSDEETLYPKEVISHTTYAEMLSHLKGVMDEETISTLNSIKQAKSEEELSEIYDLSVEILKLADGKEIRGVVISQKNGKFIVQTMEGIFILKESEIIDIRYP